MSYLRESRLILETIGQIIIDSVSISGVLADLHFWFKHVKGNMLSHKCSNYTFLCENTSLWKYRSVKKAFH